MKKLLLAALCGLVANGCLARGRGRITFTTKIPNKGFYALIEERRTGHQITSDKFSSEKSAVVKFDNLLDSIIILDEENSIVNAPLCGELLAEINKEAMRVIGAKLEIRPSHKIRFYQEESNWD